MERNWLIRTSQNQILGPVAKQKLLEFIQKGALGLTDEVTSGNGYWFLLKEKDLVEKYLYGDVPQGYNPITESKSVLAQRENPEKTTSLNTAPVNRGQNVKPNSEVGLAPKEEDLEFPDITVVRTLSDLKASESDSKLPEQNDLEFPDVSLITSKVDETFTMDKAIKAQDAVSPEPKVNFTPQFKIVEEEEVILPPEDDLAFPDVADPNEPSIKVEKGKVDLSQQYTRTVALDFEQASTVLPNDDFKIEDEDVPVAKPPAKEHVNERVVLKQVQEDVTPVVKKERALPEDKKLLHGRKKTTLVAKSPAQQRDPNREVVHQLHAETASEPLKKRNDNYIFFILIILVLIILAVFFYFKEILNKPLPV